MPNMKKPRIVVSAAVGVVAFLATALWPRAGDPSYPDPEVAMVNAPTADSIALFHARATANPNALDLTILAQLQARYGRETGDVAAFEQAESALTDAIALQPNYSVAVASLSSVYLAQHRFHEALVTARRAHELNPRSGGLVLAGDVLVATGDYEGAAGAYSEAAQQSASPGLAARLAHLDELHGRPETAIVEMERAATAHLHAGGSGEEAAWYQVRLGELNFTVGDLHEAQRRYQAAVALFPDYYAGLAGLGRVAAARADFETAIDLYTKATSVIPRPDSLAALGDLHRVTGNSERADDAYATVEAIAQLAGGVYNRNLALFFIDHGRAADGLALAEEGLETRRDIYGYDTKAWALYRLGRYEEARSAIDQALVLGTRDSLLLYHSGAISAALGENDRAAAELGTALDLNENFHPIFANEARRLLTEVTW